LVERLENNIILTVLAFFKGAAFFVALVFLVFYGWKMMKAFDEAEKLKEARIGILNVFLALVFIKIIDYLYFIAQAQDFKSRAIELVVQISKFL
jgi:divalent metal cation (Fe/Co/Zn/Cd) transporter